MGCASSHAADDAEYARARGLLQARGLLRDGKKGDFDAAFSPGQLLGRGGFSQVRAARRRADGERLAVKVVAVGSGQSSPLDALLSGGGSDRIRPGKEMRIEEVVCELATWSAVQGSKHVVNLVSAILEKRLVYMVMERCENSILRKVTESPVFWAQESRRVLKEMLLGVQACHHADIVHRDIKPQNFLLGADGSTVKLCDFGLAVRMSGSRQLRGMAGTIPFASPEMLSESGYGKATDMWSFGIMAYYLGFGELPFNPDKMTCEGMRKAIQLGLPARSRRCLEKGGGAAALVQLALWTRPIHRCTVDEALAHWHLQEPAASAQAPKKLLSGSSLASGASAPGSGRDGAETESTGTGCTTPGTEERAPSPRAWRAAPTKSTGTGRSWPCLPDDGSVCL
jgi:serine/threonine protein kinase